MSTYFVNAGGSATAPYDTPAKGTTTLRALTTAVSFVLPRSSIGTLEDLTKSGSTINLNT